MARLSPNSPAVRISPEVARMLRLLRSLPDEEYVVWHRLGLWDSTGPDFMILKDGSRPALIKVSPAIKRQALTAVQPELIPENSAAGVIGSTEQKSLEGFFEGLTGQIPADEISKIPAAIAFPNIPASDLSRAREHSRWTRWLWISSDVMNPREFSRRLGPFLSARVDPTVLHSLRKAFTPEVVIPAHFTVREPIDRNTAPELTEYLLDIDQEWVLKCDLDLSQEAERASGEFSVRLVNGVAGSGKTLIIVYRAMLLRELFPKKRILVLTHNRPLIRDIRSKYASLTSAANDMEMRTFLSWCYVNWPKEIPWSQPIGIGRQRRILAEAWAEHLSDTAVTAGMLEAELGWCKDRCIETEAEYLDADRTGRGFGLAEGMRRRVFAAITQYQHRMEAMGKRDWGDIPMTIWKHMQADGERFPKYDAILIDEAQFFAPVWFEIIKRLLRDTNSHLFLVADPTQGFLGRRQSWLSSGLEVRGRSHRLDRSYRTTRSILDFATYLYRARLPEDDDDIVAPNLEYMPPGKVPVVVPMTSPQDEITRVVNEIRELVDAGIPRKDILVIHESWKGVESIIRRLCRELGQNAAVDPKEMRQGDHIRVCTLNAATGLESPIVFLVGLKALFEREQSIRVSDEERVEIIRDNTRKIYMAITRAGQRVVITYVGELPDWLKKAQKQRLGEGRE